METRSRPIALNIIKTDFPNDDMERKDFVELDLGKEGSSYGSDPDALEEDFTGETKFHYKDFGSIDWYRELAVDQRKRARDKEKAEKTPNIVNYIRSLADAASGWIIVTVIGLLAGFAAGVIDIATKWLSDLKSGYCRGHLYLNQEQCCWSDTHHGIDEDNCTAWRDYGNPNTYGGHVLLFIMYCLMGTLFATIAVILVKMIAPYACGSGIPEVKTILSGFIMKGYLGLGTLLVKTLTMPLAVSAGLMLGKEGPLVHVACCCGHAVSQFFPKYRNNQAKLREMLSASAAAGVSVAFGAPIGGVLFSLEEVSYYFPLKTLWRSFFCALIAAFSLRAMNPFGNQHLVLFYVEYDKPYHLFELFPFIILGILGGLYGILFINMNLSWCRFRKRSILGQHPLLEVVILALGTSILAYPNPYTRIQSGHLIRLLFKECKRYDDNPLCDYNYSQNATTVFNDGITQATWQLILALLVKSALTVITFGIKVPAGLFIPSMVTGAITGRLIGILTQKIIEAFPTSSIWEGVCADPTSCIEPGLYSMVGAAAALGGVTRMTVSLVVIMFEVTGGLQYIVPFMVATMASKWIGDAFGKDGIYDGHITLNEYPYLDVKIDMQQQKTTAGQIMNPKGGTMVTIPFQGSTTEKLCTMLADHPFSGFPIVTVQGRLVAFITREDLQEGIAAGRKLMTIDPNDAYIDQTVLFTMSTPLVSAGRVPIRLNNVIDYSPVTISEQTSIALVLEVFRKLGCRQVFVLRQGELVGLITKKDLLQFIYETRNNDQTSYTQFK